MSTPLLGYMAIDQYGTQLHLTNPKNPRKQLLEKLGVKSAKKQFTDMKSGPPKHTGYVARGSWWTLYEVHAWHGIQTP